MGCDVGVVILCHGPESGSEVNRLIVELLRQGIASGCITVVCNPSGDDPPLRLKAHDVALIMSEANLGYAGGMNLGIADQQKKGRPVILLLTMDVRLEPKAVATMIQVGHSAPDFGVLGPELRWTGDGHMSWGARWDRNGNVDHILTRQEDTEQEGIVE